MVRYLAEEVIIQCVFPESITIISTCRKLIERKKEPTHTSYLVVVAQDLDPGAEPQELGTTLG